MVTVNQFGVNWQMALGKPAAGHGLRARLDFQRGHVIHLIEISPAWDRRGAKAGLGVCHKVRVHNQSFQ